MSSRREPPPDFRRPLDERLGAVVSAIVVLGGVTGAFCVLAGRFDDPRPLSNAGVLLGMVACVMLALIAAAARLDDGMRRRLMLCAVLSLSAHLAFGLTFDLRYLASHRARDGTSSVEGGDPAPKPHLPADWQAASPIGYVSAFESPVPTAAARDESLPSQKQPAEAAVLAERMRDVADPSFQPDAALPARIAEQLRPNLDAPAAPVSRQERRDEVASVRPIAEPRFAPRPSRALEMPDPSVAASRQSRPRPSSKAPVVSPETIAAAVPAFSPQTPPPARSEPAPETADETMPLGARHQAPGLELAGALELPLPKGATDRAPPLIEPPPEATAKILATAPEARRSTAESRTPLPHDWQTLPVATPTLRRTSASPETTELAGPIRRAPSNISAPAIRVETPAAPAPIAISSPDAPLELASRAPLDASRRPMGRLSPSTTGLAIAPEPRADATAIEPDVHPCL